MDKLVIEGGGKLKGTVTISGSKNAALPAITAALLASGRSRLRSVPRLMDIRTMGRLIGNMGCEFKHEGHEALIDTTGIRLFEAPYELVKTMRASVLVLCPLVARFGTAKVSLPGGCAIGARPINLHLMGLEKMGAKIKLDAGYVTATAKRLKGARIYFDIPTVTGTENLMMAATLAKGTTVLENSAMEPEVVDLANMLIKMGAKITGAGESTIVIEGMDTLAPVEHTVIPDRIECGTFMVGSAITGGDITIKNAVPQYLNALTEKLRRSGAHIDEAGDGLRVRGPERPMACDIETMPYPGFPTDMQAQFMALMCVAEGTSVIRENIFENRLMHVAELRRMGAQITFHGGVATIKGVRKLKAADVMATDLRASASLVLAALVAEGKSTVHRIYHLDRGYEGMERKLRKLGAIARRVKSSSGD